MTEPTDAEVNAALEAVERAADVDRSMLAGERAWILMKHGPVLARAVRELRRKGESLCNQNGNLLVENHDLRAEVSRLREALGKAVAREGKRLVESCFDCDTPKVCTRSGLCMDGERNHRWLPEARAALGRTAEEPAE